MKKGLVIVTGASRGIGLETALQFERAGYPVIISASSDKSIKDITANHPGLEVFKADMASAGDVKKFAEHIKGKNEKIECLVNNMGIYRPGSFETMKDTYELRTLLDANLFSAAELVQSLREKLIAQKSGCIINISSIAGIQALPNSSLYCVSKFALQGYSLCLRQDLKTHNIRVVTIMPGATYTSSWSGANLPEERFIPAVDVGKLVFTAFETSARTVVEEILIRPLQGDL